MEYLALGLAIALVVAGTIAAATSVALKETQKELKEAKDKIASQQKDEQTLGSDSNAEVAKREAIIKMLKTELADLQGQINETSNPAAVRARLGQLLSKAG